MVCGREGPGVEFKVRRMSSNHVNAQVLNAKIVIFDSQAHVIQVHKYCTKCETFRFVLPAGIYLPRKMKVEPDRSLEQDKFSVRYEC